MSELKDNVSSEWIRTTGLFGHTPKRTRVMMYVEGDDDVPFWTKAVEAYQVDYDIIVTTNKSVNPTEGNGKAQLLTMSGLGKSKVVAVDADYDLIIDGCSQFTDMVRSSEYVVNTTWYSLENILMMKTDCIGQLEQISEKFYEHFLRFLTDIDNRVEKTPTASFGRLLSSWKILVESEPTVDCDISEMQNRVTSMGYGKKDVWKLMRGHNLWNTIVKPVEKKRIQNQVSEEIAKHRTEGNDIDTATAMKTMGIVPSLEEYLDKWFYSEFDEAVFVPDETRRKLDKVFEVQK